MKKVAKFIAGLAASTATYTLLATKVVAQYDYDWDYDYGTTAGDTAGGLFGLGLGLICWIPICLVSLVSFAFTIMMIIDAAKRDEKVLPGKIKWIILMWFTSPIGALIYFFTRKKKMAK
ncbi:MAG: PLDc N-terminal domain-containing protein [Candidatus Dojkabacteria bacterium]|nr:PLDc N-terminal domain-containing protein [Candidatus Dojkabacteria bacterium]